MPPEPLFQLVVRVFDQKTRECIGQDTSNMMGSEVVTAIERARERLKTRYCLQDGRLFEAQLLDCRTKDWSIFWEARPLRDDPALGFTEEITVPIEGIGLEVGVWHDVPLATGCRE